jgi:hypothetical protein
LLHDPENFRAMLPFILFDLTDGFLLCFGFN